MIRMNETLIVEDNMTKLRADRLLSSSQRKRQCCKDAGAFHREIATDVSMIGGCLSTSFVPSESRVAAVPDVTAKKKASSSAQRNSAWKKAFLGNLQM